MRLKHFMFSRASGPQVLLPNGKPLPVLLLANKCDKLAGGELDGATLTNFCGEHGFAGWFEISAKSGHQVDDALHFLVERILAHQDIFAERRAKREEATRSFLNPGEVAHANINTAAGFESKGCC